MCTQPAKKEDGTVYETLSPGRPQLMANATDTRQCDMEANPAYGRNVVGQPWQQEWEREGHAAGDNEEVVVKTA